MGGPGRFHGEWSDGLAKLPTTPPVTVTRRRASRFVVDHTVDGRVGTTAHLYASDGRDGSHGATVTAIVASEQDTNGHSHDGYQLEL
jgi:hypothetical protein